MNIGSVEFARKHRRAKECYVLFLYDMEIVAKQEELRKKMKIEMDNNSNYRHLERPNLSKAFQKA